MRHVYSPVPAMLAALLLLLSGCAGGPQSAAPAASESATSKTGSVKATEGETEGRVMPTALANKPREEIVTFDPAEHEGLRMFWFDIYETEKAGDACLLISPDGKTMLIDAGKKAARPTVGEYLAAMGIEKLDYLVMSHFHEDHSGGFRHLFEEMEIGEVIIPPTETPSLKSYTNFWDGVNASGVKVTAVLDGDSFPFGEDISVDILSPHADRISARNDTEGNNGPYGLNNVSMVMTLTYGEIKALFTGDIYKPGEAELIERHAEELDADIIKVPHHGAGTSSGEAFIDAVSPDYAFIMGDRLKNKSVYNLYVEATGGRTYLPGYDGNILTVTDGKSVEVITEFEHRANLFER